MSEGGQTEAKSEKAGGARDKATRPAMPVEGGFAAGAPLLFSAEGGLAGMLAGADPTKRSQEVLRLQRLHGNAFVQRQMQRGAAKIGPGPEVGADARPAYGTPPEPAKAPPGFLTDVEREALNAGQVQWGKHADFPEVMGQTYYARKDIEIWPSYRSKVERSILPWGWQAKVQKTDAAGGVWDALATPANSEGYKMPNERPEHPGYEYYIRESGAAANNIAAAEQQHINDLDTGWAITGLAARDAINAVADEDPDVKDDEVSAKKAAADKVAAKMGPLGAKIRGALDSQGRLESALGPMMDNSVTQSRKARDESKKHKIDTVYVMKDDQKKRVLYEVDEAFKLDATPSDAVVNIGTIG